ncbi:MAG: dCTP deaminase [Bdellovibrionales bacterium]|nr:dCTP deaminase [Bdellovibrionales bacterium]
MILSDKGIQDHLQEKELLIDPLDVDCIQPASVDLKLGKQFVIIKHWGADILDFNSEPNYQLVEASEFLVPSHSFVLATTIEVLRLPHNLTAFVEGRSSIGRMGLFIQNAGWVDPGFEGRLTLELYNANNLPIRLCAGRRICQIVFCKMDQKTQKPYKGKYQGQKGTIGTRIFMDKENSIK